MHPLFILFYMGLGTCINFYYSCIISYGFNQGNFDLHRCSPLHSAAITFALWFLGAFHVIDSGHIGIYKRGGALLNTWAEPGLHFMVPILTQYNQVQVTLQTDQVKDIPVKINYYFSAGPAAES